MIICFTILLDVVADDGLSGAYNKVYVSLFVDKLDRVQR